MEKKPRSRRTPEQAAAYHQAQANKMRALAAKQARERDLRARLAIADAVINGFRKGAQCAGKHHYYGFVEQFGAYVGDEETREIIINWWLEQGYPKGPDYNPQ